MLLGDQVSRQVAIIIILAQYVLVVSLVFLGYFSLIMLLPLLSATILKYVFQVYTRYSSDALNGSCIEF